MLGENLKNDSNNIHKVKKLLYYSLEKLKAYLSPNR